MVINDVIGIGSIVVFLIALVIVLIDVFKGE